MKKEKRVLALYLILVLAISVPIEAIWIYYGEAASGIAAVLMIVPAIVAIILKLIFYRKQSLLGLRAGKPVYYLFAAVIPLLYLGVSYLLYWLFFRETFAGPDGLIETITSQITIQNLPAAVIAAFAVSILASIPVTFGEELGWRGLMYPIMDKLWGRNRSLLISGGIWAAWHLPILIGGVYMSGAALFYQIPMFIIHIIGITVIVSWLRMKSGSVWPAVLWHSIHNFFDQSVFASMTTGESRAYFVSETGLITTLCVVLCAVFILVFGNFKTTNEGTQQ